MIVPIGARAQGGAGARPAQGPSRRRRDAEARRRSARSARRPGSSLSSWPELGDVRYSYEREGRRSQAGRLLPVRVPLRRARRSRSRGRGGTLDAARARRSARSPMTASGRWSRARCRGSPAIGRLAPRARPQLLLVGVRRPAAAWPQDGHDPPRRQVPQVPQERLRARDDRLPALARARRSSTP